VAAAKQAVRRSAFLGVVIAIASLTNARPAHADATCIAAYEQTQMLRKDGKPVAAKVQASVCAKDSCPALLSADCNQWLAELEAIIPSVVLDPRGHNGELRADVRVKLDGVALAEKIDGKPIVVEPGSHTFVFEADGATPVERTLLVHEGEKSKKVTITVAAAIEPPRLERPVPLGVWIFSGVSVVALATSAVFAIDALGRKSDLDECKPRCSSDDINAMSSSFTIADVALGAGVMAGVAAAYLYLARPSVETPAPAPARTRAVPHATPLLGGGAFGLTACF
jgi:hypothetical protein